ncbi:MAG: GntR family transcriptional regulator [Burkholderiales bacterium]|nr:GntR family transcriptional regulator [Burkholderiales bacterium]
MSAKFEPHRLLQTLPLQIADQLTASIIDGQFPPGDRLLETELAESCKVSRATIRESLRLLEQRGLVTIQPQRGARVTLLSAKELDDLFEVRASLLATGSRLAAERCSQIAAAELREYLARLKKNVRDPAGYANTSAALVEFLMQMSGNAVLAGYIRDFALRIGRYVRLGLSTQQRRKASIAAWEQIIEAITEGDGPRASAAHRDLALANREAALVQFNLQSGTVSPRAR